MTFVFHGMKNNLKAFIFYVGTAENWISTTHSSMCVIHTMHFLFSSAVCFFALNVDEVLSSFHCVHLWECQNWACCYKELCFGAGESYPQVYRQPSRDNLTHTCRSSLSLFPTPIRLQCAEICQDHTCSRAHIQHIRKESLPVGRPTPSFRGFRDISGPIEFTLAQERPHCVNKSMFFFFLNWMVSDA